MPAAEKPWAWPVPAALTGNCQTTAAARSERNEGCGTSWARATALGAVIWLPSRGEVSLYWAVQDMDKSNRGPNLPSDLHLSLPS